MNVLPNNKLLSKLVTTVDSSRFILICDHLGSNSLPLVQSIVYNRLKQFDVNIVFIEKFLDSFLTFRKPLTNDKKTDIKIIDFFSKYDSIDSNLSQHLMQSLVGLSEESILLIDSLTPLLLVDSLSEVSRLLNQLSNRFRQIICVLHVDSHSTYVCESIEYFSHFVIHLTTESDKSQDIYFKAIIRQRKPHRKTHFSVKQSMEFFKINEFMVKYKDNQIDVTTNKGQTSVSTAIDPTLNLPFNLNLKDNELEAKNSLIMPYIKTDNESKVYYEFDKNDDIDEDDPDDDLDI